MIQVINESNVKPGSTPVASVKVEELNDDYFQKQLGLSQAYVLPLPYSIFAVFMKTQVIDVYEAVAMPAPAIYNSPPNPNIIQPTLGPNQCGPPVSLPPYEYGPPEVSSVSITIPMSVPVTTNDKNNKIEVEPEPASVETQIEGKWVRPTLDDIRRGRRCRCIVGSNAGREALIKNVVREGSPDAETQVYSNSAGAGMRVVPMFPKPDAVTVEWSEPQEGTTMHRTIVDGVELNKKQVVGPVVTTTLTKKRFLDEFLVWG